MKSQQRKEKKMATAARVAKIPAKKPAVVIPIKDKGEDLGRKTVCLILHFGTFGNSRRVSNSMVEVDADPDLINVQKQLLDSPELEAIYKADNRLRCMVEKHCVPFDVAIRLVPWAKVPKVTDICRAYEKVERPELVKAFMAAYKANCERAAQRLRGCYRAKDYPDKRYVESKFKFNFSYRNFGVPGELKNLDPDLYKEELDKAKVIMRDAADVVEQVRREALLQFIEHLGAKLETDTGKRDGKPKIFRDSAVTKLQEFLDEWETMDVTGDTQVKPLIEKGRALLKGVSPEGLRTTDTLRDKVRTELNSIAATLETMVEDRPTRKFRDED